MKRIKQNLVRKALEIGKEYGHNCVHIKYDGRRQNLQIKCPRSFEDRTVKSLAMFMLAFEKAKPQLGIKSFNILLNCEDFPEQIRNIGNATILSYSKKDEQEDIKLFPDFCFLNWKESGMKDYEECRNSILEASKKEPAYNTLFWIGNPKTHPTRETLCQLSQKDPRIEAYGMGWDYRNGKAVPSKFVSLEDHTLYKYLIDVQGRGYSGRTKMLMFTGRPLFIAERKWKEFWNKDAIPFTHFIPVKEDLSDLQDMLDWAESNPDKAQKIAENAKKFALENLTRDAAIDYFAKVIADCAK